MEDNRLFTLSMAVTSAAMGLTDRNQFPANCNFLYEYFCKDEEYDNIEDLVHNDSLAFHIGSAFYFMGLSLKNKESSKYKFSVLASFLNLYNALSRGDMQACIAAHRLFILLTKDKSFIDVRLLAQAYKLNSLLSQTTDDMATKLFQFKLMVYNFLSQFIVGNGSVALSLLNTGEQSVFREEFAKVSDNIKNDTASIKQGNTVINAIRDELVSAIEGIRYMGIID
jgi:hypothetical protein